MSTTLRCIRGKADDRGWRTGASTNEEQSHLMPTTYDTKAREEAHASRKIDYEDIQRPFRGENSARTLVEES